MDVRIEDYVGNKRVLTAEEVRKLPVGAKVEIHSFDRHGEHQWLEYIVTQSGKKKVLVHRDPWSGMPITKRIGGLREGRQCYTEG